MHILSSVLHHCADLVPDSMAPSPILDLAKLADKYDCTLAMEYVAKMFLQPYLWTVQDMPSLSKLLVAAYYFKGQACFGTISTSIIWRSVGRKESHGVDIPEVLLKSCIAEAIAL